MNRKLFLTLLAVFIPIIFGVAVLALEPSNAIQYSDKDLIQLTDSNNNKTIEVSNTLMKTIEASVLDLDKSVVNKKETKKLAAQIDLFVSLDGSNDASGTIDHPFRTLEDARDRARTLKDKTVNIWLRNGTYFLENTFNLTESDSRRTNAPLIFSAWKNENVSIVGGKIVNNWKKVTDQNILNRLPDIAKNHVMVANLKDLGIHNFGATSIFGVQLYSNNNPMLLARWPNKQYAKIASSSSSNTLNFDGSLPKKWLDEDEIFINGYLFNDWYYEILPIRNIDIANQIITLKSTPVYGIKNGQVYFLNNILAELDSPKEWYLDNKSGLLYFWPEKEIMKNYSYLSVLNNHISIKNTSNIYINNLTFKAVKEDSIIIKNSNNIHIDHCKILNIGRDAVTITGSKDSSIKNSELTDLGAKGIMVTCGSRESLLPGNIIIENNHIHNFSTRFKTYNPAISLYGVGNQAIHNLIHNGPHFAIYFAGNDHLIAYNEIYDVVKESNDAGVIYAGRDWTMRGNVIINNYIHDIAGLNNKGAYGVYLDDLFSSASIIGNIFFNVKQAVHIGGGRDNIVEKNIFINCPSAIILDSTGLGWRSKHLPIMMERLNSMPYKSEVWSKKYPELSNILEKLPLAPQGNIIQNNTFNNSDLNSITMGAKPFIVIRNNQVNSSVVNSSNLKEYIYKFTNIPFASIVGLAR